MKGRPRRRPVSAPKGERTDMDDSNLAAVSNLAGRLQVDLSRGGKLIQSCGLDIDAVERLAEHIEQLDGPDSNLEGSLLPDRGHARRVSRQLRALASALRIARDIWSEADDSEVAATAEHARALPRAALRRRRRRPGRQRRPTTTRRRS